MGGPHEPAAGATSERSPPDLAEQLAELTRATGGLAHEIRNPLSTLRVNLQLLAEDWRDIAAGRVEPPSAVAAVARRSHQRVDTLLREVDRLAHTLDDYLLLAGQERLSLEPHDLRRVASDLVQFFEPQATAAGVGLLLEAGDAPVVCEVDANLLKQAVLNLLINAQQSLPAAGTIRVRVGRADRTATIDVIDDGPGIPADQLAHIFEPYYSTRKGGTGLGLPIARRIAARHGGTLRAEGAPGRGARFTIELPLAAGCA